MDTIKSEFLTSAEVIKLLRISKSTLHRWIEGGKLKTYRTGKRLKFNYKDVSEMIKEYSHNQFTDEEERIRHIKSMKGKYAYTGVSTGDFIKRKLDDIEMEERK